MRRSERGFNIVELLITITVMGVVVSMGAPHMADFIADMRLSATTNDVLSFFNYARSEAAKRGARVTLCVSDDQATCITSGADWGMGAVAFVDSNSNGQVESSETVLRVFSPVSGGIRITPTTAFSTAYYFYFRPSGAANSQGTLRVCRPGRMARDISVSSVGRPFSQTTTVVCT